MFSGAHLSLSEEEEGALSGAGLGFLARGFCGGFSETIFRHLQVHMQLYCIMWSLFKKKKTINDVTEAQNQVR